LRHCVKTGPEWLNLGAGEGSGQGREITTVGAETEDFQMMSLNCEIGVAAKIPDHFVERAAGERHDRAAFRADEMMPMTRRADDVRRMAARLQQPGEHIDRGQYFERPINGRPTNLRHLVDKLLSSERAFAAENRLHDPTARRRHSIAMLQQQCIDFGRLKLSGGRSHAKKGSTGVQPEVVP
jgi:hypothetical protein